MNFGSLLRGVYHAITPWHDSGSVFSASSYQPKKKVLQPGDPGYVAPTPQPRQPNVVNNQPQLKVQTPENLFQGLNQNLRLPGAPNNNLTVNRTGLALSSPPPPGTVIQPNQPHASILHNLTHNPVTNTVGNVAKSVAQFPIQTSENFSNTFANLGNKLAEGKNQTIQQNMGGDPLLNKTLKFSGATGTNKQLASDAAQTALWAALPLADKVIANPITNKLVASGASKLGTRFIAKSAANASVMAAFNALSAAGNGESAPSVLAAGLQGAATAPLLTAGGIATKGAAKGIKTYDAAQNQIGAVGKNVNNSVSPKLTPEDAKKLASSLITSSKVPSSVKVPTGTKPLGLVKTVTQSQQTSAPLAKDIQGSYNPITNKAAMAGASQRIAEDPVAAHTFALTTHSAEGNATAIQIAKQLEAEGNHQGAADLMVTKAQQALQAGQGNQIYSLWDKLSPETVAQTAAKTIEKYNQTARSPIPQLTADQYKGFVNQAQAIQSMADGSRERGVATQNLLKQIGSLVPSSKADKAFSLYRTGLLTGFRTPGKVVVSHAVSNTFEQAKNVPAIAADKAMSLFTGKRGVSLTSKGNVSGGIKGVSAAVDNLVHGYDAPGSGGIAKDFANNVHFGNSLAGKVAQGYVDTIGHLHGSLYKPFYGAQHLNSLYDMAITNAKNQGIKGAERDSFVKDFVKKATDASVKDPTQDIHSDFTTPEGAAQRANAEAAYTTFQNKTALSEAASAVKQKTPGARYIVPFSQIPSSIASKVVDYSPVGPFKEAFIQVRNGNFDQRTLSQAIGRGATGTGIAALGYHLFNSGHITTAYPTDPKEQAQWQLEGKQANSILVGGKWRQLASLGPAGDTLAVGANVAEGMKGNKKTPGSVANAAIQGGIGGINVIGNSPYLQGVQNVGSAISQPGTKSQKVAEGLAGGLIPTAAANIASAADPLQRQTNSPIDSVTNKIPGLREKNLPKVDVLGNDVARQQGALGNLIDPFYSTTAKTSPVIKELNRLNGTYNPATPAPLTKGQSVLGQKLNLNPQQLTELEKETGQPISQQLSQLIDTAEYKQASDETKAKAINDITSQVRSSVKQDFATGSSPTNGDQPLINTAKLTQKAQLTLAKDSFDKSGKSYQVVGDTVLRRGADGTITATPKVKFDYQIGTATLTKQKTADDLTGWLKTAQGQLNSIDKQLKDPSIDPLDALTLQNDAQALVDNMAKYQSYGGFTKPKAPKALDTSFGALKDSKFAPSVQQYASIDAKAGSVPHIAVQRPNIVHKISAGGGI